MEKCCKTCEYCAFGTTSSFECVGSMHNGEDIAPHFVCDDWELADRIKNPIVGFNEED